MGEQTEFNPGDQAPNDGLYREVGESAFHMNINNPKSIELRAGQHFPETTNHNRKWKRAKKDRLN